MKLKVFSSSYHLLLIVSNFKDVEYAEVRFEDGQTENQLAAVFPINVSATNTDVNQDQLYAIIPTIIIPDYQRCDYSKVYLNSASSSEVNPRGACVESNVTHPQSDFVYSFAQLPKW